MKLHKVVDLFPPMVAAEVEALRADIEKNGVRVPIVVWKGKVIDGRNRYEACRELGIDEFEVEEFDGTEEEMVNHVVALNMSRRQLNSGQKAAVGVELGVYRNSLATGDKAADGDKRLIEVIANELGTNRQYLYDAEKLKGSDEDLFNQVRRGDVTLSAAMSSIKKISEAESGDIETVPPPKPQSPTDSFDKEVPAKFAASFAERENFKYVIGLLREAKKATSEIAERGKGSTFLDISEINTNLQNAETALKSSMPHALCPYCEGKGCDVCKTQGWVNRPLYDYAPDEKK